MCPLSFSTIPTRACLTHALLHTCCSLDHSGAALLGLTPLRACSHCRHCTLPCSLFSHAQDTTSPTLTINEPFSSTFTGAEDPLAPYPQRTLLGLGGGVEGVDTFVSDAHMHLTLHLILDLTVQLQAVHAGHVLKGCSRPLE